MKQEKSGFQPALTVKTCMSNIVNKDFLLPAIQREFVWDHEQIVTLFDSLMRGYPINSFLFWQVDSDKIRDFQFYDFIRDYTEYKATHSNKATILQGSAINCILDGQQRLTALYIGLLGSYSYKIPWKRWDNPEAFPKRRLYLNVLSPSNESERGLKYDLKFLTKQEAEGPKKGEKWFEVGNILDFSSLKDIYSWLRNNDVIENEFSEECMTSLFDAIVEKGVINNYLETTQELDKVLNIFIRVNRGGTPLSYSDLLLSIATAEWKNIDAREEITNFVDDLNAVGDEFDFDKDLVLKASLILSDIRDFAFKVDNFNSINMKKVEENWDSIKDAIRMAVKLVSGFGYNWQTLTSSNALIPIAYFITKKGIPGNFAESSHFLNNREDIRKWLVRALIKRQFSGTPDNVLRKVRDVINSNGDKFPVDALIKEFRGTDKSLDFSEDDVDALLSYEYADDHVFSILSLIYPAFNFSEKRFHIDHIFPKNFFTPNRMTKLGVRQEDQQEFLKNCNKIGNLQLLPGLENQEKSSKDFLEWLNLTFSATMKRNEFLEAHLIPKDVDMRFSHFLNFLKVRNQMIREQLKRALYVT